MNKAILNQPFNEVSEPNNDNVVELPKAQPERQGIQFLPSVSAYVERVLGGYPEENVRWNGLDVVKAVEKDGRYYRTLVRIKFPFGGADELIKVTGPDRESALPD